jgi:cytosolic carboxypeptidase protein 2/3
LISDHEDAKQLREDFIFKVVPMLNPDGVINGSYRCSLSGYDLNRVWHCDNKISSPEIYYTKKAIVESENCILFIDLHAHSKKKGVFMYGCQNINNPFISRQIPYLFWKEIPHFNYYQCNFGMKSGREGTSRLNVHRTLNLIYSYTMEYSFCGPVKEKYHFNAKHYREFGKGVCQTLKKYYASSKEEPEIFKELY